MTENHWILQANPKRYNIDQALVELDQIWWRIPQHMSEVHVGDAVIVWRSGKEAGIVGVGRVAEEPQIHGPTPEEAKFSLLPDEDLVSVTRALVSVKPADFVPKLKLESLAAFVSHPILTAPLVTVFPLSQDQWGSIQPLLPNLPDASQGPLIKLPPVWAWDQRAKGVMPMPGGYSGYLDSLLKVCDIVAEELPTSAELAARLEVELDLTNKRAVLQESFLRKVGLIEQDGGKCRLGLWTKKWRDSGNPRFVVALLHARCRFIGEMMAAAVEPKTADELRLIAKSDYGLTWDTPAQVANRRGWLQSSGMLEATDDSYLRTTAAGIALLDELELFQHTDTAPTDNEITESSENEVGEPELPLIAELVESAIDSGNPARFEQATCEVLAFLGFQAEWLGGAGKTDVLVDAQLEKVSSYRVVVDCKSSASGTVGDSQVNWPTLKDHKAKHDADYILLVAPKPSGKRLFERAHDFGVSVLSVERLSALCQQHLKAPLGLEDYRVLFVAAGESESDAVDERAEELIRLMGLADQTCVVLKQHGQIFGRLSAHDLLLLMTNESSELFTTEDELQAILDTLASSLVGIVEGNHQIGYKVVMSPEVARARLAVLGVHLSH